MLVLSRKLGEEVVIGANIRVQVVAIQGNKVRLGFDAPDDVAILRRELSFEVPGAALETLDLPVADLCLMR